MTIIISGELSEILGESMGTTAASGSPLDVDSARTVGLTGRLTGTSSMLMVCAKSSPTAIYLKSKKVAWNRHDWTEHGATYKTGTAREPSTDDEEEEE